jgi:hypothetical protein
MPERLERLRTLVHELETELETLDQVDPETQQILQEAAGEIQAALEERRAERLAPQSMREQLLARVDTLEVSHPTLASVVARMAHALGQLGI